MLPEGLRTPPDVAEGPPLQASKLEAAYHRADKAIQQIVDLSGGR